jgi:hypothetical protein
MEVDFMMHRLCLAATFLVVSGCQTKPATLENVRETATTLQEVQMREAISKQVELAIQAEDFKALSAMEQEFLSTGARTSSGIWKLGAYHASVQFYLADGLLRKDRCEYRMADFVTRWATAEPASPAPIITHAHLLREQAWCFRGNGYAASVTADDWPKFYSGIEAANETLETYKDMASVDPEFYAIKASILLGSTTSPAEIDALVKEATDRVPDYHRFYRNAVWHYMPQWGGSDQQIDQFARFAARTGRETEGTGFYARMYWNLDECDCGGYVKLADWPTLKAAMRDVYIRYPSAWNREYFMKIACRREDRDEVAIYAKAGAPHLNENEVFNTVNRTCARVVLEEARENEAREAAAKT